VSAGGHSFVAMFGEDCSEALWGSAGILPVLAGILPASI
jgi:hypothetical protein